MLRLLREVLATTKIGKMSKLTLMYKKALSVSETALISCSEAMEDLYRCFFTNMLIWQQPVLNLTALSSVASTSNYIETGKLHMDENGKPSLKVQNVQH